MRNRILYRWGTPLGRVISEITVSGVVKALSDNESTRITNMAVYRWIYGKTAPRPQVALRIVELAHGSLTMADVYQHRVQVRRMAREIRIAARAARHAGRV